MSWYFTYYIGKKEKDGKLYPLGPYDCDGELHHVRSVSTSFASHIYESFQKVPEDMISKELFDEFSYDDWISSDPDDKRIDLWYLPLDELPKGSSIVHGYFLQQDIEEYLRDYAEDEWADPGILKYRMLSVEEYASKANHEVKHGLPKPEKNEWGEEMPVYSAKEYSYFAYEDTMSEAYESGVLREAAYIYKYADSVKDAEIVILMTQG